MYMYYLLGYKILANSDAQPDPEPEFDSVSGILKKSDSAHHVPRCRLTSSELRRRRTAAHFTRSVIFNYVPEEVQVQVRVSSTCHWFPSPPTSIVDVPKAAPWGVHSVVFVVDE